MIPKIRVPLPAVDEARGLHGSMPMEISRQCASCRHWTEGLSCRAFPDGIPSAILSGQHDHTEAFPGDHGMRFEPVAGQQA